MATRRTTDSPRTPPTLTPATADEKLTLRKRASKAAAPATAEPQADAVEISADARRGMIAEAAYLRAEARGFAPGYELDDWIAAESEVDSLLEAEHSRRPQ
jgi:hypothetical protein